MPKPTLPNQRWFGGFLALLAALSLVMAACSSDSSDGDRLSAGTGAEEVDPGTDTGSEVAGSESTADGQTAEADAPAVEDETVASLFPDVDVINIADGMTINLARTLEGGDTPVLFWFWAPH